MVANHFLGLLVAVPFVFAGPCKPQSSSIVVPESILSTSLLETATSAVSEVTLSTSTLATTTIEVSTESSESGYATTTTTIEALETTSSELSTGITTDTTMETTPTTLTTSLSTAEPTTEPATTSSQVPAPPMGITCPAVNNQCLNNVKIECDRGLLGVWDNVFVLSNLDECARKCIDDLACTAFVWLTDTANCLVTSVTVTPDRATQSAVNAVVGVRGRCTQ